MLSFMSEDLLMFALEFLLKDGYWQKWTNYKPLISTSAFIYTNNEKIGVPSDVRNSSITSFMKTFKDIVWIIRGIIGRFKLEIKFHG
jgi:hypothetical protein